MKLFKDPKTGIYKVSFRTNAGITRSLSTKCAKMDEAKAVVKESRIRELEMAAKANALSQAAITQILAGRKITVEGAIKPWLEWMDTKGMSRHSIANNQLNVVNWIWDARIAKHAPAAIKLKHIADWLNHARDLKASTLLVKLAAIRSFIAFCISQGWMISDPTKGWRIDLSRLTHTQKETRQRRIFTQAEIDRLLAETKHDEDPFWHVAVALGRYTGLRIGDIATLEWASLSKPGKIRVWTEKRDKRVSLALEPETLRTAVGLMRYRHDRYCFPGQQALYMDVSRRALLSVQFKRLCDQLEIHGVTFHDLRRTYVTECQRAGLPIEHIAVRVGHASTVTTRVYVVD